MSNVVRLPQLAWYETRELELPLPDNWQVEVCNMAGYNRPALEPDEIRAAIRSNLIGIPPIRELTRGRNEVVILFDDMTRVTRAARIVPYVLEELAETGIPDDKIRFIVALGCHGALDRVSSRNWGRRPCPGFLFSITMPLAIASVLVPPVMELRFVLMPR